MNNDAGLRVGNGVAGLTLVELLVSLALAALLAMAGAKLLLLAKTNYLVGQELARLQENGRYAVGLLGRELSMAGFLGGQLPLGDPQKTWVGSACFLYLVRGVSAFEHRSDVDAQGRADDGSSALPADCLPSAALQAGTDLLLLRRTKDRPHRQGGQIFAAMEAAAVYLSLGGADGVALTTGVTAESSELWQYHAQLFFVRAYSRQPDDNIPTLCRKRLSTTRAAMAPAECLVEGVENLQLTFGLDDDADGDIDRFAEVLMAGELALVRATRIYLVLRSTVEMHAGPASSKDGYLREVFQTSVAMPNLAVGSL